jgi:hypothetical protein
MIRRVPHDLQDRITADIHKIMNTICRSTLTANLRRMEKCVDNAGEKRTKVFLPSFRMLQRKSWYYNNERLG